MTAQTAQFLIGVFVVIMFSWTAWKTWEALSGK
jgi:hypothetical protein